MDIVIDANELFSCIIAKGKKLNSRTLDIFFSDKVRLHAPMKMLEELGNNRQEIIRKSGFSHAEYTLFLKVLTLRIDFAALNSFSGEIAEAKSLAPHLKDAQYFGLALKLKAAIWSEEKAFKRQSKVQIFSTNELWTALQ